ncbi:uncharacterized protein MELLADRAFT_84820 [Melampsora larici-populina 98AG31]|uniref:CxC1-like cysteine cluster associated with KDZ transposases domain-containing protein n=1 Tax=Melampsora larici-populina (strain 98AG31 / pathotype 3-4-7) TaxID=747676 RepID=F4SCK5_MELLP|nr:uncharacterized protein MELLADRAFT_84820 [Melampsora larici-populina 98AG31]EGF97624.1 hypothetical protein MELLADRAFT_84820 [Melampsora larici-populina 98AG31]
MVLPGEEVRPPPKRSRTNSNTSNSSVGDRLANLLGRENAAAEGRMNVLQARPPVVAPVAPIPQADRAIREPQDQALYNAFIPEHGLDDLQEDDDKVERPAAGINRADYYRSETYQERVLKEEANWEKIMPALFLAYVPCSRSTFQWVDPVLWNHDFNDECRCPSWKRSTVNIDTIDWSGRTKTSLMTCRCTSDAVRLLRRGYIGGTPAQPRTAYSIRLLRFHHILWKYCSIRIAPFVEALDEYLDPRSSLLLVSGSDQTRDWRKGFSAAVDAYRELLQRQEDMTNEALQLSPEDILASTCPACFGPEVPGKRAEEPRVVVCLDGNFQQRRHLSASAAWRGESGVMPALFMSPLDVKSWETRMVPERNKRSDVIVSTVHKTFEIFKTVPD